MAVAHKSSTAPQPKESIDDFLDLAGHELRSPITALKGHVQLLQRRLRHETTRAADLVELDKMMYQIERLNHELDIYLEASHLSRNRFHLSPMPTDFITIARRLIKVYSGGASGHAVHLETTVEFIEGQWDRKRVEIALSALVSNALKYSHEGDVDVHISHEADAVRVEVSDHGVGVPAAERRLIFEPYGRGSNVENTGAGLGLYVARESVRRQGGRIGLRARPGGGSIFWFTLPLQAKVTGPSKPKE